MKLKRHGAIAGIAIVTALALAACGSDNTESSSTDNGSADAATIDCATGTLTAQGSTAQKTAMDEWVKVYQQQCPDAQINYQGTGSGAGVQAFIGQTADFAGSDSALKEGDEQTQADARCADGQAVNLPMVVGPIAVAYNLDGVDDLQLSPSTIAKIFSGAITTWDDAAIQADNPDATLPSTAILAIHRSDSSGTTDNFTKYLTAAAPDDWTYDHDKVWMASGGQAEKGSDGVASAIARASGTIGYVEWSYAQVNDLGVAKVQNGAGEYTELTGEAAGKAVEGAEVTGTGDDLQLSIDYTTTEAGAYPIILVTYEIVCTSGNSADTVDLLKSFLSYTSSTGGQALLEDLGYAALPETLRAQVETVAAKLA